MSSVFIESIELLFLRRLRMKKLYFNVLALVAVMACSYASAEYKYAQTTYTTYAGAEKGIKAAYNNLLPAAKNIFDTGVVTLQTQRQWNNLLNDVEAYIATQKSPSLTISKTNISLFGGAQDKFFGGQGNKFSDPKTAIEGLNMVTSEIGDDLFKAIFDINTSVKKAAEGRVEAEEKILRELNKNISYIDALKNDLAPQAISSGAKENVKKTFWLMLLLLKQAIQQVAKNYAQKFPSFESSLKENPRLKGYLDKSPELKDAFKAKVGVLKACGESLKCLQNLASVVNSSSKEYSATLVNMIKSGNLDGLQGDALASKITLNALEKAGKTLEKKISSPGLEKKRSVEKMTIKRVPSGKTITQPVTQQPKYGGAKIGMTPLAIKK